MGHGERWLLRPHRERPSCRAAEQRDERAAFHSITSSARASRVGGTSRGIRGTGRYGKFFPIFGRRLHPSGLILAARITLPHFSASSLMCLPKSAGEPASAAAPKSASRAF